MAMRVAAPSSSGLVLPRGLRALYSAFSFNQPHPHSQTQTQSQSQSQTPYPSTKLFISGLSRCTTSEGLCHAFTKFGELVHAKVITDRVSGYSKCFGYVKYTTIKGAEAGIKGMDGQSLDGWVISVEYSRPRQPPPLLQNNYTPPYGRQ